MNTYKSMNEFNYCMRRNNLCEVTDMKKDAVLRGFNVCMTGQRTDVHDLIMMFEDALKNVSTIQLRDPSTCVGGGNGGDPKIF